MVQWIGYSPFFVAEADSGLPKSLRIIDYAANYDIIEAIKSKELDAALLTLDEVIILTQEGIKLYIILILDTSNGADAILAKASIQNIRDLRAKRVAYEPNSVQEYLLSRALKQENMSLKDIEPIFLKYDQQSSEWENRSFDAIATFEPKKHKLIEAGMHTIFDSSNIPNEIIDTFVVTQEGIKNNPLTIQKTVNAYFSALLKINQDEKTHTIIGKYLHTTPKNVKEALRGVKIMNREENKKLIAFPNPHILKYSAHVVNYLQDHGRTKGKINIRALLYPEFISKDK
ncbi:ABC transporter substrate-binding protein [bacterium]|nr:ABC transporter substrate-binding protein [bacterium]MBU1995297.1 ABC transporter substrate-binding protein [bacterium]